MCEFAIVYALPDMRQNGELPEISAWNCGSRRQRPNLENGTADAGSANVSPELNGKERRPEIVGVLLS